MQITRAREMIQEQMAFSSGYNRNAVRMILGEVARTHGPAAVARLFREFDLERHFELDPQADYSRVGL
jgi:hypothetical protein